VYVRSPIAFHELAQFVTLRVIRLVLVRFGQKAVVLPCPVATVSYDCVATPGGMLTGILCRPEPVILEGLQHALGHINVATSTSRLRSFPMT